MGFRPARLLTPGAAIAIGKIPKHGQISVLPLVNDLEFRFATSDSGLSRKIATDTAIAMGHPEDLAANSLNVLSEILGHIREKDMPTFVGLDRCQAIERQMTSIEKLIAKFLLESTSNSGILLGHTAAWTAKAIWKAKLGANVQYEPIEHRQCLLSHVPLSLPFGVKGANRGPALEFTPTEFNWYSPPGFDRQSLVFLERRTVVGIPGFNRPVCGYSASYSVGEVITSSCWEQKFCGGVTQSIEARIVNPFVGRTTDSSVIFGNATGVVVTNDQNTSDQLSQNSIIIDAIAVRVGRVFEVVQTNGNRVPCAEYLIIALHPETLELVYLGSARGLLHDFATLSFDETPAGKWLYENT